jgi:hypothetical protein
VLPIEDHIKLVYSKYDQSYLGEYRKEGADTRLVSALALEGKLNLLAERI